MASAFEYPEADPLADAALLAVDMQLLPFVLGAVTDLQERKYWQSDDDWYRACEAISEFLECSMSACLGDLLAQNDRLYRLLDAGLNGTVYTAAGDPVVVSPSIGDVPAESVLPGLLARVDHVELMLDDLPGVITPGWFGVGGEKATIADIVKALRIGDASQSTEAIDSLAEILGASADLGTIGGLITDLLGTTVSTIGEGGMLLLTAGIGMANVAALQNISLQNANMIIQNQRIISALDGGALFGPDDSILGALRGITEASEERNVIDAIVAALALVSGDNPAVIAKLEEIRVLLA